MHRRDTDNRSRSLRHRSRSGAGASPALLGTVAIGLGYLLTAPVAGSAAKEAMRFAMTATPEGEVACAHGHPLPVIPPPGPPCPVLDGIDVTITAYSSEPGQTDDTPLITATGNRVRPGIVALSRDLLESFTDGAPFRYGDRVWIEGLGEFRVDDTMNRRWSNRIDIWCASTTEARRFGCQSGTMYRVPRDLARLDDSRPIPAGDWSDGESLAP